MSNPFSSLFQTAPSRTLSRETFEVDGISLPIVKTTRRKSIAVKHKNSKLFIEAPKYLSNHRLVLLLEQNRAWLGSQIHKLTHLKQTQFTGQAGAAFEFLEETFHCVWDAAPISNRRRKSEYNASFEKACLLIRFKDGLGDSEKQLLTNQAVEDFFIQQSKQLFAGKLDFYADVMNLDYHSVQIKGYKSRWGSCYPDGRIQFNWRLLQAPEWVVDYVVVHELAHRVHANHSPSFWQLVEAHYPQTRAAKKVLKINGQRWINFLQKS